MELDAINWIRNCSPWVGGGVPNLHSAQTPGIMKKNKTNGSVSEWRLDKRDAKTERKTESIPTQNNTHGLQLNFSTFCDNILPSN